MRRWSERVRQAGSLNSSGRRSMAAHHRVRQTCRGDHASDRRPNRPRNRCHWGRGTNRQAWTICSPWPLIPVDSLRVATSEDHRNATCSNPQKAIALATRAGCPSEHAFWIALDAGLRESAVSLTRRGSLVGFRRVSACAERPRNRCRCPLSALRSIARSLHARKCSGDERHIRSALLRFVHTARPARVMNRTRRRR